ncbi:hypothetical protein OG883_28755 [Streptomyces sp. NBC_01142]|uniref:hypothetical protein n=1 Tax=Streptomyces sp. NBC_01142 TaxID=2975865 RepID=UPI0022547130|nr:hypothetical protein [Streptomyces sp. NBC_01142]MCX4823794.1 hypothetical protein [Streptomyces sp. NBC_01142]
MPESAMLSVLSLEPMTTEDTIICVVRCIEGAAALGMRFRTGSAGRLTLTRIEWYGREVEQLDTVHSGKVTLTGAGAELVRPQDALVAAGP